MKAITIPVLALALSVSPVVAQEEQAPALPETLEEFADSMRKLLEGFADDVAPLMEDLASRLEGLQSYHPPEMLPNGDIIIRRKTPSEQTPEPEPAPPGEAIDI